MHNALLKIHSSAEKAKLVELSRLEVVFGMVDRASEQNQCSEMVNEWFTRLIASLLNLVPVLHSQFCDKVRLLALVKNVLEATLQKEQDPFSTDSL